jgi:hypothetical protein
MSNHLKPAAALVAVMFAPMLAIAEVPHDIRAPLARLGNQISKPSKRRR